jgi:hypothetical protein
VFNQVATHLVADLQGWFTPGAFDDVPDERLLDTRSGARRPPGSMTAIAGRPNTTGVVSIVVTETEAAGYVQVLECGSTPGASSNLNADAAGQTRSGLAFVRFDSGGRACLYNQRGTHLVADLQGYMADASFDDIADDRVLDTRAGPRPGDGRFTEVRGRPGSTAVVSIVATDTTAPGYVQVLPCGVSAGGSSNLNVDAPAQTIAGLAFVRFEDDGRVCVFTQSASHLVVDVQGYLIAGAFVDVPDRRVLDTRTR